MTMPLTGFKVLELGTLIAGPFTGRLLGDFGAEVIKIETPENPDPMRHWGVKGSWWFLQSRNKKSISLNLRHPEGKALFLQLVQKADVVVENFRPGTLEKWGVGYEVLSEVNPRLVLARTSGFGQTGPYKDRAGFGSVGEAMGGLRHVTGFPDRPPNRIGISIGDTLTAMFATIGILAALLERERSGKGQVVDTALYEAVFAVMESTIPDYLLHGVVKERMGNILKGLAPSNIYRTKDDKYIVMGANADKVFGRLCQAMNQPELAQNPKYTSHTARGQHQTELDDIIERWTVTLNSEECLRVMEEYGIPSGKIYSAKDMVTDPHYQARDMIVSLPHPEYGEFPMPAVVPKFSRTPGQVRSLGASTVGAHNSEIYSSWLGLSPERIQQLKELGVI